MQHNREVDSKLTFSACSGLLTKKCVNCNDCFLIHFTFDVKSVLSDVGAFSRLTFLLILYKSKFTSLPSV